MPFRLFNAKGTPFGAAQDASELSQKSSKNGDPFSPFMRFWQRALGLGSFIFSVLEMGRGRIGIKSDGCPCVSHGFMFLLYRVKT